jgi:hypothetical protein
MEAVGVTGLSIDELFRGFLVDVCDYVRDLFIEFRIIMESRRKQMILVSVYYFYPFYLFIFCFSSSHQIHNKNGKLTAIISIVKL